MNTTSSDVESLHLRISELENENEQLRAELEAFRNTGMFAVM